MTKRRLKKKIKILIAVLEVLVAAGIVCVFYLDAQRSKIIKEVTIETGDTIRLEDFFEEMLPDAKFYTDVSSIDTTVPGSYGLIIEVRELHEDVVLNVVDTTPPTGTAVPQTIYTGKLPSAEETVTDIYDLSAVTVSYKDENPDVSTSGEYDIPVVLTDTSGNQSIVNVPFTVIDDHLAPLIYGAKDFECFIGEPVSYLEGITVTDNYDPNPVLTVDTSEVNTAAASTYPVTYTATDENGNSTSTTVYLTMRVKPDRYYEPEVVYDLARQTIEQYQIYEDDMTDVQKAFRIYNWCYNYIHYTGDSDKSDWTVGAYDGLTTLHGDCYTYYAVCKALLDVTGIENCLVERYPITWSAHYWNLVYLDGLWYHCDACYAYYHEGYYFMYADSDLNPSDHGYDPESLPGTVAVAQESIQDRVNYYTLEVEGT